MELKKKIEEIYNARNVKARSNLVVELFEAVKNGSRTIQEEFVKIIPCMTLCITPHDMYYLACKGIVTNVVIETGEKKSENRPDNDWNESKVTGFIKSIFEEYDRTVKYNVADNPFYMGCLNKFTIMAYFDDNDEFQICFKDGGHRYHTIVDYMQGKIVFAKQSQDDDYYNQKMFNKSIIDNEVIEVLKNTTFAFTFVDEEFDATILSDCKGFTHANKIAMRFNDHPLFLGIRRYMYNNDIRFHKDLDENTYRGLFILSMINGYHNGKTHSVPALLGHLDPNNITLIEKHIELFDKIYREIYIPCEMVLSSSIKGTYDITKTMGLFHTFYNMVVLKKESTFVKTIESEYEALINNRSCKVISANGVKSISSYIESEYMNNRQKIHHMDKRFAIATNVCDFAITNLNIILNGKETVTDNFNQLRPDQGSGHAGCEKDIVAWFTNYLENEGAIIC